MYPNVAIHGQACKVELMPLTILLSGFCTELTPHLSNVGRYEMFIDDDIFSAVLVEPEKGGAVFSGFSGIVVEVVVVAITSVVSSCVLGQVAFPKLIF